MDYRKMYSSKLLRSFDLEDESGRKFDRTLVISACTAGELTSEGNKKDKLPILTFDGEPKQLGVNKTNGKVIAGMYGKDTREWQGKAITVYATTTKFGRDTVDCVRVRPTIPTGKPGKTPPSVELSEAAVELLARIEAARSEPEIDALRDDNRAAVATWPEREQAAVKSTLRNRLARLKEPNGAG